jgi:hypothetical protein
VPCSVAYCDIHGRSQQFHVLDLAILEDGKLRSLTVDSSQLVNRLIAPTITPGSSLHPVILTGPCPASLRH